MPDFDQDVVNSLLQENLEFKRLYEKHTQLKQRVRDANFGVLDIDDFDLENMKKEKLFIKDRMAHMIQDYQRSRISA